MLVLLGPSEGLHCGLFCSASSYLLGLTPLPFKPFFVGTIAAMSIWGPLYASIGAASKALLVNGGDIGELVAGALAFLLAVSSRQGCWPLGIQLSLLAVACLLLQTCSQGRAHIPRRRRRFRWWLGLLSWSCGRAANSLAHRTTAGNRWSVGAFYFMLQILGHLGAEEALIAQGARPHILYCMYWQNQPTLNQT